MSRNDLSPAAARDFRAALLTWFDLHKRDLPWRRTRDPYAIWVSEIMLQQTRVAAVLEHYARWMARFPTIEALAAATQNEVLAAWSGLGYYRRARFLHQGAQTVLADHNGKLPRSAAELRTLPGIGAYTSAAIASIAFGEAAAVVDGNVERVLLRQSGGGEHQPGENANRPAHPPKPAPSRATPPKLTLNAAAIQQLASRLLDPGRPGDSNQAIMELGATVCLPRNPLCLQCPVENTCRTRGEHPAARRKPPVSENISYGLVQRQRNGAAQVLLEQRAAGSTVMPSMWDLPRSPATSSAVPLLALRHAIMQTNYRVTVVALSRSPQTGPSSRRRIRRPNHRWIELAALPNLPLTGLARKILLRLGMLARP